MRKREELLGRISDGSYRQAYTHAKATGICMMCGKPAKTFKNASSRLEYQISALCQHCQDGVCGDRKGTRKKIHR